MRKSIIVLGLLFLMLPAVKAQSEEYRFSLVLKPALSWMKSNENGVTSNGTLPGYNVGVLFDYFFANNFAFATGITVNTAGGKLEYPIPGATTKQTYRLKYVELPVGMRLRSDDIHRINIYGRFGLSPQINIKAVDSNGDRISDEVRPFDVGYHLGAGIEYSLGGRNALMFGLLLNNGFTDITKRTGFDDKAIHNRLVFEIGFIF